MGIPFTSQLAWLVAGVVALGALVASDSAAASDEAAAAADRAAVVAHVDSIFRAYVDRDVATIRRTHTTDWTGFQGPSRRIERGIDDYMANAERSLEAFHGTGYELFDTEVQLYGDLALVYYVARYDYVDAKGVAGSLGLRSLDVYRRENDEWIQCGSHITPLPEGGAWGEGE